MDILGVDSGLRSLGWVIARYDDEVSTPRFVAGGVLHTEPDRSMRSGDDSSRRAVTIFRELKQAIAGFNVAAVCVEGLAFPRGKIQLAVVSQLGRARGLIDALSVELDVPIAEATPQEVKKIVPVKPSVTKEEVQAAVLEIADTAFTARYLSIPKGDREHLADACAVVLACMRLHPKVLFRRPE